MENYLDGFIESLNEKSFEYVLNKIIQIKKEKINHELIMNENKIKFIEALESDNDRSISITDNTKSLNVRRLNTIREMLEDDTPKPKPKNILKYKKVKNPLNTTIEENNEVKKTIFLIQN